MTSPFDHVESCGRFQVCHLFSVQLIVFINVWSSYLMVFGNYEPPWHCRNNDNGSQTNANANDSLQKHDENVLSHYGLNANDIASSDNDSLIKLTSSLNSTGSNDTNPFLLGTCAELYLCDDVIFDPESVTLVSEYKLICDQAFVPAIIFAVQRFGMLIGTNAGGQLAEIFGRKISNYGSLALVSMATFAAAWSTSWQMYTGLVFLIGLGSGGISSFDIYALEFLTPKWRGRFGAFPMWNISLLIFAFIIIGLKVWWQIHILCGVAGGLFLFSALWTPESLRWLHAHGKEVEAEKVMKRIMKCNGRKQDTSELFSNLNKYDGHEESTNHKYTYLDLIFRRELRILTTKTAIIWFSVTLCYFTLGFSVKAFSGNYYTNLLISCVSEIPFILITAPCLNILGRRITGSLFMSLTTLFIVSCLIVYYALAPELGGTVIKYLAFLAKGCSMVGWSASIIFSAELFPTVVRSLGFGFLHAVTNIAGIITSTLIPRDQQSTVICFFVLGAVLVIASIIVMTLPETKNKPLIDTVLESSKPVDLQADIEKT